MKLLDLDSSLSARKQLAKELNYTGDTNDSAKMSPILSGRPRFLNDAFKKLSKLHFRTRSREWQL